MKNNELEDKLMGNALSYQETLSKILGPLNEMSPIAKAVEEQLTEARRLTAPIQDFQKQLKPIQDTIKSLAPSLNAISETCKEERLISQMGNLGSNLSRVCYEPEPLPAPDINPALFIRRRDLQIDAMRHEISELKNEIRKKNENDKNNIVHSPQELLVLAYSKQFQKDYYKLIEIGYMRRKETGYLEWLKSKQSLAEYFGSQEKHGRWCDIENLFQHKRLGHLLSVANGESKDFKKLKLLLKD